MFQKVLISDDLGSINEGVVAILNSLSIKNIDKVQYCDDAYLKVKAAIKNNEPYDLLITDLSFQPDHREQQFSSGEALIKTLKSEHPELKIIVYSVEDRLQKVRVLIKDHKVNAYVCKGRRGLRDLTEALKTVSNKKHYVSSQVSEALNESIELEFNDYDIELLRQLSNGLSQDQISILFKEQNISPSSLSSIEKHLNRLRIQFRANNAIHLVAIVKDLGLI